MIHVPGREERRLAKKTAKQQLAYGLSPLGGKTWSVAASSVADSEQGSPAEIMSHGGIHN